MRERGFQGWPVMKREVAHPSCLPEWRFEIFVRVALECLRPRLLSASFERMSSLIWRPLFQGSCPELDVATFSLNSGSFHLRRSAAAIFARCASESFRFACMSPRRVCCDTSDLREDFWEFQCAVHHTLAEAKLLCAT